MHQLPLIFLFHFLYANQIFTINQNSEFPSACVSIPYSNQQQQQNAHSAKRKKNEMNGKERKRTFYYFSFEMNIVD
jgi:hypothetical protein